MAWRGVAVKYVLSLDSVSGLLLDESAYATEEPTHEFHSSPMDGRDRRRHEADPLAQALAATEMDAAAPREALKSFSGQVPHATHYGPLIATAEKGRIVKIEAQASDKKPSGMAAPAGAIPPNPFSPRNAHAKLSADLNNT